MKQYSLAKVKTSPIHKDSVIKLKIRYARKKRYIAVQIIKKARSIGTTFSSLKLHLIDYLNHSFNFKIVIYSFTTFLHISAFQHTLNVLKLCKFLTLVYSSYVTLFKKELAQEKCMLLFRKFIKSIKGNDHGNRLNCVNKLVSHSILIIKSIALGLTIYIV